MTQRICAIPRSVIEIGFCSQTTERTRIIVWVNVLMASLYAKSNPEHDVVAIKHRKKRMQEFVDLMEAERLKHFLLHGSEAEVPRKRMLRLPGTYD